MDNDDIGPGIGTLIGLKMASVENRADEQRRTLDETRARLRANATAALYEEAFALAAADVIAAILVELQSGQRRLSDPASVAERNELYARKAATHVRQLSKGQVRLRQADVERIAADRPLK